MKFFTQAHNHQLEWGPVGDVRQKMLALVLELRSTLSMLYVGKATWIDIKILQHSSASFCMFVITR